MLFVKIIVSMFIVFVLFGCDSGSYTVVLDEKEVHHYPQCRRSGNYPAYVLLCTTPNEKR